LPGLKVEEKFVPFKQRLSDSETQNFDAVVSLWGGDYPEGSTFYDLFKDGSSYNNGQFKNAAYTKAVNRAETTNALNDSARDADYKEAESAFRSGYSLARPNVKGVIINTTGLNIDLKYAYRK